MAAETSEINHDLERLRIARPQQHPRRQRNRWGSVLTALVVLAIAGSAGYLLYARTVGRPPTVKTMLVTATTGSQPSVLLTGSGYIVTRHKYIIIGTKILGQIVDEPIEEGQLVKTGDILARIDDRDYQAQLQQATAIRELAKANLSLSQSKAERLRRLSGTGAISADDFETATNAVAVARAQLERDEAAVSYAKFNVDQCIIRSPITGTVLKKYREVGDTINFGGQIQAGGGATDIAQLADTQDMRAEVDINEADIAKIAIHSPATVVLDSYTDRQFDATLVKVYPEADRQKGTVKIEVQIHQPDLQIIRPEMSAKVSFLLSKPVSADAPRLVVPKSAVKMEGTETYVWTVRDGGARRTAIVRVREMETGIEVKGLTNGDMVIVGSDVPLKDGQKVSPEPPGPAAGKAQSVSK